MKKMISSKELFNSHLRKNEHQNFNLVPLDLFSLINCAKIMCSFDMRTSILQKVYQVDELFYLDC
jgi:hypothetical protein